MAFEMTHKGKAAEISLKFRPFAEKIALMGDGRGWHSSTQLHRNSTNRCAVVCVKFVIEELESHIIYINGKESRKSNGIRFSINKWKEVLKELENDR